MEKDFYNRGSTKSRVESRSAEERQTQVFAIETSVCVYVGVAYM